MLRRHPVRRQAGFTLIEIMVVVVILAILGTFAITNIIDNPDEARVTKAQHDIRTLESALRRRHLSVAQYATKSKLDEAATKLVDGDSADDLYLAMAAKRLQPKQVLQVLAPEHVPTATAVAPPQQGTGKSLSGVLVEGIDAPAKLAHCCAPVRGDDIIGYITRGRGVTVHRLDCPNVKHLMMEQGERFMNVSWDSPSGELFPVDFEVIGIDRPGLLKDVVNVIPEMNKSASRIAADVQSTNARIHFRVDVKDQEEVDYIKSSVGRVADVTEVYRQRPGLKA